LIFSLGYYWRGGISYLRSVYYRRPLFLINAPLGRLLVSDFLKVHFYFYSDLKERNEPKNASVSATVKTPQIGRLQCGANET